MLGRPYRLTREEGQTALSTASSGNSVLHDAGDKGGNEQVGEASYMSGLGRV